MNTGSDPSRRLYMDNAATSFPKPPAVMEAMVRYAADLGASAGRGAYREAMQTGSLLNQCRQRLNRLFNGENANHFVFGLNCTEALNLAIKGLVFGAGSAGGSPIHAICTQIDHNSILRPLNALQDMGLLSQTRVAVDPSSGLVDPRDIERAIGPRTRLIAITHASNVTGTVQPIRQIGRIARERGIPLIVDAAQSAGHVEIDVQADGIDLLAAPGHKGLMGPLGTGLLYIRPGMEKRLAPLKEGGTGSVSEQDRQPDFLPDKYESGSHNAIGIIGLSAGVQWVLGQGVASLAAHERELSAAWIDAISNIEGLSYFGPRGVENRVGVFSVRVEGLDPHELAGVLETAWGILSRAGIHCAPLAHQALGTAAGGGTTRLSFGPMLQVEDVVRAATALEQISAGVRQQITS